MLGMFVFLAAYFAAFVAASALFVGIVKDGTQLLFAYHAVGFSLVCVALARRGEMWGFAMMSNPNAFNNFGKVKDERISSRFSICP